GDPGSHFRRWGSLPHRGTRRGWVGFRGARGRGEGGGRGCAAAIRGGVRRSGPRATSWPEGAQGWSVASRARTVSHVSAVVGGRSGRGTVALSPGPRDGTCRRPVATATPSDSRVQSKRRWARSRKVWRVVARMAPDGAAGV